MTAGLRLLQSCSIAASWGASKVDVSGRAHVPLISIDRIRVIATREIPVQIRTQLITVGVLFALALPAASNDATAKVVKVLSVHSGISTASVHKSNHVLKSAGSKNTAPVTHPVIYIDAPPISTPQIVESQPQICQTQGLGCTDEQYCSFWNINCNSAANVDQASGVALDAASSDQTTGNSPAADPADQLLALENEYCCDPSSCGSFT